MMTRPKPAWTIARIGVCAAAVSMCTALSLATTPAILAVHEPSLTEYLPTSSSSIQDVFPLVQQRGVNLDGSLRAAGGPPFSLAGNPFGEAWNGNAMLSGVRLDTGTAVMTEVDLALPAPGFSWVIGRSYNARQHDGTDYVDSDGYQGWNWFQMSQPELVFYDDPSSAADDLIYLIYGADRYVEFKRKDASSTEFKGVNGAAGAMQLTEASEQGDDFDIVVYTDQHGWEYHFFGFDDSDISGIADAEGQIWKIVAPGPGDTDVVAFVGDADGPKSALLVGYDEFDGRIGLAQDTAGRTYYYDYDTSPYRLTEVEVKVGSTAVARVEYSYYQDADAHGDDGELKLVTISTPLTESGDQDKWLVRKKLYRYYDDVSSTPERLKYVYDFEGYRRYDWEQDQVLDDDPLGATEANLEAYAGAYFEYDGDGRITEAWFNGACGCSGAVAGTHEFTYGDNGSYSDDSGYDTEWATRTVVQRPETTYLTAEDPVESWATLYFDEVGQPLHLVETDGDPTGSPAVRATKVVRDSGGRITAIHSPANVTGYTHSTASFTTDDDVGLITVIDRFGSNYQAGYVDSIRHQEGVTGSAFYDKTFAYTSTTKIVGSVTVVRLLVDSEWDYTEETTDKAGDGSDPAGAYKTTYTYDFYGEIEETDAPLMVQEALTTHPIVTAANNGSGTALKSRTYFDELGRVTFEKTTDGIINHYTYTDDGRLSRVILDADTESEDISDDVPFNFHKTGLPLHRVNCYTYKGGDGSGLSCMCPCQYETDGNAIQLGADSAINVSYTAKLADGRIATLNFAHYEDPASGSDKYYGPVTYTLTNHAGGIELEGAIALSLTTASPADFIDEDEDDPFDALHADLDDVTQLAVSVFSETGHRLLESQQYFSVPGTWPGSEGANFDTTEYGYDDMGRLDRVADPTGTIQRTVFDWQGRMVQEWTGTNDNDFDEGSSSGDDNMVQTAGMAYDANGNLTSQTLYVQGSATGKRETLYSLDVRGNVLLVENPTAPHTFNEYDNLGRVIASARYADASGIDPDADSPTSETGNRLTLKEIAYDQIGRVFEITRHEIDQSDGSDLDDLETDVWYGTNGRVIKVEGKQLTKTFYDRLGRQTHEFILSDHNDYSNYSGADDVDGDHVLQERQTVYDSADSDDVVMTAVIDRFHDDYDQWGAETTGALDADGDGDLLKYTDTDLEGRIQITAMWYDVLGRVTDTVQYGDNDGATFDRSTASVPARSGDYLVTSYTYDDDGTLLAVQDPASLVTRYEYDAAGRRVTQIDNYLNGTPSGVNGDDDRYTRFVYLNGLMDKLWVDIPPLDTDGTPDGEDQVTAYTYGVSVDDSPGASTFDADHLLRQVTYPDSGVVRLAYNAQGDEIWTQDQAGNVLETDYDDSGRALHLRATTIDADFDDAVQRISATYDGLGRPVLVSQYDNDTVGAQGELVLNEVKYSYDDWGLPATIQQDRDSEVGGSGTGAYQVSFSHEKATGGRRTIRRSGMTMPDLTTSVSYTYFQGVGQLLDNKASRVTRVTVDSTIVARYWYNGVDQVVGTVYLEPDPNVTWNQFSGTTGDYPDLDRFNRVTSSRWTRDLTTDVDFYDLDVSYDADSNVTLVQDNVHEGFDVAYTLDGLNRLTQAEEGTWSGSAIDDPTRDQTWENLSQTGNWDLVKLDLDGSGTYTGTGEYEDLRTHNLVNELTARDVDNDESDDFDLVYDDIGNLIDDDQHYKYEYDVFGRLVTVRETTSPYDLVAEFEYNGLGQRIGWHYDVDADDDVDGDDPWFYFAYDDQWRIVATFHEDDDADDPKEQFYYHAAGLDGFGGSSALDAVILRDKDAN